MKKRTIILLMIVLFIVGIFAFLGVFVLVDVKSTGVYDADQLPRDLFKSILCCAISLSYQFYYVLKKKQKSD